MNDGYGDEEVEVLPNIRLNFGSVREDGCAYFHKKLLLPVLTGLGGKGSTKEQEAAALCAAVQRLRYRWIVKASQMAAAGFGSAGASTWTTRVNCRPVMVYSSPHTSACALIHICPFCYARKCWSEYAHLRNIMFVPGEPHSWRRVTANVKRMQSYAATTAELELRIRSHLTSVRERRASQTFKSKLKKLKGWFRSHKLWVTPLNGGGFRIDVETMMLGTTLGEEIPATLFLTSPVGLKTRGREVGMVHERTWYNPRLKESTFRKWMQGIMRYRKEWLDSSIEITMAYNSVLHDMRFQQFYMGGEFRRHLKHRRSDENQTTE